MGEFMKGKAIAFFIAFLVISILVCGCLGNGEEEIITTPADEMILTEADFENNWTSWWTCMKLEGSSHNNSGASLEHYTSYPIDPRNLDLRVWIQINVINSTAYADAKLENWSELISQNYDLIDLDIGDDGFQYEHDNDTYAFFRVKNVVATMYFFPGFDGEKPDKSRIVELLELQESNIR
jgi:hypothetical protein